MNRRSRYSIPLCSPAENRYLHIGFSKYKYKIAIEDGVAEGMYIHHNIN